jgi:hypothetical protein
MVTIVDKARELQHNYDIKQKNQRIEKERAYRRFLEKKGHELPDYNSLARCRKTLVYIVFLVNLCFLFYMFMLAEWTMDKIVMFNGFWGMWIPIINFMISFCLSFFAVTFDFVIWRRWPEHKNNYCFIDW